MTVSGENLGETLLWALGYLAVLSAVAGLAVWIARRRGSTTIPIDAALAVAQVWLLFAALGSVAAVWRGVFGSDVWLSAMPIQMQWPAPLPFEATGEEPELLSAAVPSADATLANLSVGTRAVLVVGDLVSVILAAFPALVIVVLCRRALRGEPFASAVSRWLLIAAGVILVAGMSADVLHAIGSTMASREVLPDAMSGADVTAPATFSLSVPLWPIGAALALAALAAVFRQGTLLQRDTQGLV